MRLRVRHLLLPVLLSPILCPAQAKPEEVRFPSGKLTLHGFLYKPEGSGPFPAVLWNHGSEPRPGWLPELGPLFVSRGYVLFIPHRHGQGRSPGPYIMDLLAEAQRTEGPAARSRRLVELMEEHLQDQEAAFTYLKGLSSVDPKKIAVAGCSFGAIQTVLAASQPWGLRAAIDFAGGAESWEGSPDLRERMSNAVRKSLVPIFFIQAANDYDLAPSKKLSQDMEKAGKPYKLQIFPAFGTTAQEGHEFCVHGGQIWASEVFAFLGSAMQ